MIEQPSNIKPEVRVYLQRIGYEGPVDHSAATLAKLQACHLHTVPYETLDIIRRTPISLEQGHLYDKIVTHRRGGFCFELNALFGWLLRELGYTVTDYFARFWRDEPNPPPMRRHQVLKVEAEGVDYLCDVGVGGIVPRWPMRLQAGLEQRQEGETYKMERDPEFGWQLLELKRGEWKLIYTFTEERQLPQDYVMASYWCEHSPDSIFTAGAMLAIRTKEGRNTVAGQQFRIFTKDEV
ncbi:MAG: N-acetyltransferase, partial [Paenibacillus sp.]|nr:N-acetyltransferase [Paenibacillus sp.]